MLYPVELRVHKNEMSNIKCQMSKKLLIILSKEGEIAEDALFRLQDCQSEAKAVATGAKSIKNTDFILILQIYRYFMSYSIQYIWIKSAKLIVI